MSYLTSMSWLPGMPPHPAWYFCLAVTQIVSRLFLFVCFFASSKHFPEFTDNSVWLKLIFSLPKSCSRERHNSEVIPGMKQKSAGLCHTEVIQPIKWPQGDAICAFSQPLYVISLCQSYSVFISELQNLFVTKTNVYFISATEKIWSWQFIMLNCSFNRVWWFAELNPFYLKFYSVWLLHSEQILQMTLRRWEIIFRFDRNHLTDLISHNFWTRALEM